MADAPLTTAELDALAALEKGDNLWLFERHHESEWPRQRELRELIRLAYRSVVVEEVFER